MPPTRIPAGSMSRRWNWLTRIPIQPTRYPVRIHLFAPNEARARLAEHPHLFFANIVGRQSGVELVSFPLAVRDDRVEVAAMPRVICGRLALDLLDAA